jgi:putative mRNA 3-end processing factor
VFHYDRGLKLTKADLAIDFRRRQRCGFISHAHVDHMARHEYALCTPATSRLYQYRFGARPTIEMPYREAREFGGLRLTTLPAGHCLGSAMLLAEDGDRTLLYTGDFKLSESATAERAELPRADILVIESTYGDPRYRLTPRAAAIAQLLELVHAALAREAVPVIQAYVLGKAQEVTRILTDAGIPVLQHREIFGVSQVYEACGVSLGRYALLAGSPAAGHAVVVPPRKHRMASFSRKRPSVTFAVTGWAMDASTKYRWDVDYAIPLSDHADYDELFTAIDHVQPREIFCTHGPVSFVDRLREAGLNAYPLDNKERQLRLF